MGFLTTICFRNDRYHDFATNPIETMEDILMALSGNEIYQNSMIAMKPSHADIDRVFVQTGNSLFEIGYASNLKKTNKEFYKEVIKRAKAIIRYAEKELKELENINKR